MRRNVLLCSTVLAGVVLSTPVFAQTAPDTSKDKDAAQDVVVTGSRIKRDAFTAPDPIQVITAEQATLAGYADTASLLQQSSIASGSFQTNDQLTGFVVTGGPGSKTLNLRRLGANRTIILLDGKRLGPAGVGGTVGPVDLNVIAQSSIAKIEVLKDGASSIYGSDAVAGVVNIITKKNHDGGELSAYTSQPQGAGGASYLLSGDYGKTFDKGYIELGGEFYEQLALHRGERAYNNCSEDYLFNPTTGARLDYTDTLNNNYGHNYKCYNLSNNDVAVSYVGKNPVTGANQTQSATLQYKNPLIAYPTAAQGNDVPATVSALFARQARAGFPSTYPYANYYTPLTDRASIISPDRHYNVNFNGGYDFNSTTHLYAQFNFSDRFSYQMGARQLFPTLSSAWSAGNPNNIFLGTGVTPIQPIIALPSDYRQDVKYYRGVIGLKGDFTNLGWFNRFSYDVYGVYSKSQADYQQDSIYNDRVVATSTSAAACNPATPNLSSFNCSALGTGIPWLSSRVLSGNFTSAERNFLFFKAKGSTDYDQYILEGDITGDLFTLPAGPVGLAIGTSYRHDEINDTPDPQAQAGNLWGQTASGHTQGSDSVKEAYAELTVPVLKNLPLIQNLNFDISGRYSDYDSYGSTTTYKVSGNWTIIPDVRLRGSIGTSFRAPALYELYLAHQTGFLSQASVDPCYNYGASGVKIVIQNACAALGIPNSYVGVINPGGGASATVSTGGGKGSLSAETSQAKSIGIVVTPKHFGIDTWSHLSVAVDYFDFQVHSQVSQFGAYNIISQCLQGNTAFCGLYTRDTNAASPTYGNVLLVNNNYVNVASQGVRGLDLTVHADHNFGKFGRLGFDLNATWTFADKTLLLGGTPVTDYNGTTFETGDGPDFTGNASLQWDYKDWTVFWNTQVIGKGSDTERFGGDTFANTRYSNMNFSATGAVIGAQAYYKQYVETTIYHDVSVRKRLPALNVDVIAGVKNLFGEEPPAQSTGQFRSGSGALNSYDVIGRQYFFRVTKKW